MSLHPALVRSRTGVLVADGLGGLLLFTVSVLFSNLAQADANADAAAGPLATPFFIVAALVMAAAVAVRRLHPAWALGLAWASTLVHLLAVLDASLTQLGVLVVLASAAHYGSTRVVRWSGASVAVGTVLAFGYLLAINSWLVQVFSSTSLLPTFVPYVVLAVLVGLTLAVPWLIGLLARTMRLSREGRERARASQAEAQRASEIAELQAARTLLARDVHDIVGHSLAVIIAQAESVRFRDVSDPEGLDAVRGAVATIAQTARRSLGEVRHVLESTAGSAETAPATNGADAARLDLDQLLDDVARSRAGMVVERANSTALPQGDASVALYRAVQELLTNALRHGDGTAPLLVTVASAVQGTVVTIENTVSAGVESEHPPDREGTGIEGARSRLASVGGSLECRRDGAIFRAIARVPSQGTRSA